MQYTSNEDLLPFDYGAMLLILILRNQEADGEEDAYREHLFSPVIEQFPEATAQGLTTFRMAGNRGKNFSHQELLDLAKIIGEIKPMNSDEWALVTERHNELHPHDRNERSLRLQFAKMHRARPQSGNPTMYNHVYEAKKAHRAIRDRAHLSDGTDGFNPLTLPEDQDEELQANPNQPPLAQPSQPLQNDETNDEASFNVGFTGSSSSEDEDEDGKPVAKKKDRGLHNPTLPEDGFEDASDASVLRKPVAKRPPCGLHLPKAAKSAAAARASSAAAAAPVAARAAAAAAATTTATTTVATIRRGSPPSSRSRGPLNMSMAESVMNMMAMDMQQRSMEHKERMAMAAEERVRSEQEQTESRMLMAQAINSVASAIMGVYANKDDYDSNN